MIIIHELKTIVIMAPRTCSTSLKVAIKERWPNAMMLYRHMEADGVPFGYEGYRKVGFVRPPASRLWSLYNYCLKLETDRMHWSPGRSALLRHSVETMTFFDWLKHNPVPFCSPWGTDGSYGARYAVRHILPETIKSQNITLRPDLGTKVVPTAKRAVMEALLDVELPHLNSSDTPVPKDAHWRIPTRELLRPMHSWDAVAAGGWFDDEVLS